MERRARRRRRASPRGEREAVSACGHRIGLAFAIIASKELRERERRGGVELSRRGRGGYLSSLANSAVPSDAVEVYRTVLNGSR